MADDIAKLGIEFETSQVKAGTDELRNLETVAKRTGETLAQVQARFKATEQATRQLTPAVNTATGAFRNFFQRMMDMIRGSSAVREALSGIQGQMVALSAGAGPVGTFLAGLGPMGLIAAAGFAGLGKAMDFVSSESMRMAEAATNVRQFALATDLTFEQISQLKNAGEEFGLTLGETQSRLQRLTFQMAEAQQGSGNLFEAVQRLGRGFAQDLMQSRDLAGGIEALARAYRAAGDASTRAQLARAAFGRGGEAFGPVLGRIADVGGIRGLEIALEELGATTIEQAAKWAKMRVEIENTKEAGSNILASIFTETGLNMMLTAAQAWKSIAERAKAAAESAKEYFSQTALGQAMGVGSGVWSGAPSVSGAMSEAARSELERRAEISAARQAEIREQAQIVNTLKQRVEALGPAASAEDQLNLKIAQQLLLVRQGKSDWDQFNASRSVLVAEAAHQQLEKNVSAMGNMATAADQAAVKTSSLNLQLQKKEISAEAAAKGLKGIGLEKHAAGLRATSSALGDSATAMQKYEAQIADMRIQLARGDLTQAQYNQRIMELHPAFILVKDAATSLFDSLISGFIQGGNLAEAFNTSLKSIAQTAASGALRSALSGDFAQAGLQAGIAGASFLASRFFGGGENEEEARRASEEASRKAEDLRRAQVQADRQWVERARRAQTDTTTLMGAIQEQQAQYMQELNEATEQGLNTANLTAAYLAEVTKLIGDFRKEAEGVLSLESPSDIRDRIKEIEKAGQTLHTALQITGGDIAEAATKVAAAMGKLREEFTDDLARRINEATGRGFISDIADLIKEVSRLSKDAVALGADPALINRFFEVQAQRIVDEANITGDAFDDLIEQFPQLTGVVHSSRKAIEDLGRTIDEYLNSLRFGTLSTLSPSQQLQAAKEAFAQQAALAQAGNLDALSGITKTADTLLTIARAFFASSTQYASIYAEVTDMLSGLAGHKEGGLIPGYAWGGWVTGRYNMDSVLARLAGGEFITRAPAVNSRTLPVLNAINRTGLVPSNDNVVTELRSMRDIFAQMLRLLFDGNERMLANVNETRSLRTDIRQSVGERVIRTASGGG